MIMVCVGSVCN